MPSLAESRVTAKFGGDLPTICPGSRRAGFSERRFGNYATGVREPDLTRLLKIVSVLGTTANELVGVGREQTKSFVQLLQSPPRRCPNMIWQSSSLKPEPLWRSPLPADSFPRALLTKGERRLSNVNRCRLR
jgi:hypothetical protein